MLFFTPPVRPVTFTEKVQFAFDASVAPLSDMLPDPDTAMIAPPPQLPAKPFGVATTSPAGRLSVNPTPVSEVPLLGLLMVKLRETVELSGMLAAPKALIIVGGDATVRLAVAVLPVPP